MFMVSSDEIIIERNHYEKLLQFVQKMQVDKFEKGKIYTRLGSSIVGDVKTLVFFKS